MQQGRTEVKVQVPSAAKVRGPATTGNNAGGHHLTAARRSEAMKFRGAKILSTKPIKISL